MMMLHGHLYNTKIQESKNANSNGSFSCLQQNLLLQPHTQCSITKSNLSLLGWPVQKDVREVCTFLRMPSQGD